MRHFLIATLTASTWLGACSGEDPRVTESMKEQVARLQGTDPVDRAFAARELRVLGEKAFAAIEPLTCAAGDAQPLVTGLRPPGGGTVWFEKVTTSAGAEAARTIVDMGERVIPVLIGYLRKADVRCERGGTFGGSLAGNAMLVLIEAGPAAVPALLGVVADPDPQARAQAAAALGSIEDARAITPLIERLGDSDPRVQAIAVRGLRKRDEPAVRDALLAFLVSRPRECEAVATTFADRPDARAMGPLGDQRAVEPLIAVLEEAKHHGSGPQQSEYSDLTREAMESLRVLTGTERTWFELELFSNRPEKWRSWWKQHRPKQ